MKGERESEIEKEREIPKLIEKNYITILEPWFILTIISMLINQTQKLSLRSMGWKSVKNCW